MLSDGVCRFIIYGIIRSPDRVRIDFRYIVGTRPTIIHYPLKING